MARLDGRSFVIGALSAACALLFINAVSPQMMPEGELSKLRDLARRINDRGDIDMGSRRIILQGSAIYDDGSDGGGLHLRGGANRVHLHGDAQLHGQLAPRQDTLRLDANLDLGRRRIIMQGSQIFDDSNHGGGLQLHGGANRIHTFGQVIPH